MSEIAVKNTNKNIELQAKIKDLESKLSNTSTESEDKDINEMIAKVHDDIEGRYELDSHDKTVIEQLLCKLQK